MPINVHTDMVHRTCTGEMSAAKAADEAADAVGAALLGSIGGGASQITGDLGEVSNVLVFLWE